jgi:hypothetical protein
MSVVVFVLVGRIAGHQSRTVGQTLPNRRFYSLQAGTVDQTSSVLLGIARRGAHAIADAQMARTFGADNIGISGHPWTTKDVVRTRTYRA